MFMLNSDRNPMGFAALQKMIPTRRVIGIGIIVVLTLIVTTGFIWIQRDPVIAPPGLRILDWFWTVFVCRCAG